MTSATTEPASDGQPASKPRRRGCLFYVGRTLLWLLIIVVVLVALGAVYQTVATDQDKSNFKPRGQLYSVNGHLMHLVCMGEGSPAVILEAGSTASSLWWYRVQNQLAQHTKVCAYDRPGHGWSESTTQPRDANTVVEELHSLLQQAGVEPPYVLTGHSFGALWARIFAAQHPDETAGLALVDSTFLIPREFPDQAAFDSWTNTNNPIQALIWAAYRTGLIRLMSAGGFQGAGYPAEIIPELAAMQSANSVFDADYAEQSQTRWDFTKADAAAQNLGNLPMVVLWGSNSPVAQPFFDDLRAETAAYSTNNVTRMIEGADHGTILGNEQYAQHVSDAIMDVIESAQTGQPLTSGL